MASTVDALLDRLEAAGVGAKGSTLFAGSKATLPRIAPNGWYLTLRAYGGPPPVGTHNDGPTAYRRPSIQVVAHAHDYQIAEAKALEAYAALTLTNTTLSGIWFLWVTPLQSEPGDLGLDQNGLSRLGFNVGTMRRG